MKRHSIIPIAALAVAIFGASFPAPAQDTVPTQAPALRLTLDDAIERGLRQNLRVLLAGDDLAEAEATSRRARALLLPKVIGTTSASVQNRSLRAFGIQGPGIPAVVDPFSLYDFRVAIQQPLFDLSALRLGRASKKQEEAARHTYQDARSVITRLVSGLYLSAQSTEARTQAARSRVTTAGALTQLARDRRAEGVATGVDLLRAEVSLANDQQRLLEAENENRRALLTLARAIGISLGTPLELAEPLAFHPEPRPELANALAEALANRADYLALQARREAVRGEIQSIKARKLPRVDLRADLGSTGRNLNELDTTGTIQGTVTVTLFDRDRGAEIAQKESRLQRIEHQLADLRVGLEQELREALMDLDSAEAQVAVAQKGQELSERELALARTRFETGVANNIEVTNAQESVARAQENSILALARYSDARAALTRALGDAYRSTTP